jgi:hypothetical protein
MLEMHGFAWDRHTYVAMLNRLMEFQPYLNTTSATCGEETVYPSGAHEFVHRFSLLCCPIVRLSVLSSVL